MVLFPLLTFPFQIIFIISKTMYNMNYDMPIILLDEKINYVYIIQKVFALQGNIHVSHIFF